MPAVPSTQTILVKRYAQSRLYDTADGCYVTVAQLRDWSARGIRFAVIDADGTDVTAVLLA